MTSGTAARMDFWPSKLGGLSHALNMDCANRCSRLACWRSFFERRQNSLRQTTEPTRTRQAPYQGLLTEQPNCLETQRGGNLAGSAQKCGMECGTAIRNQLSAGWGGRIRTCECRYQKPVPYHLATPQQAHPLLCGEARLIAARTPEGRPNGRRSAIRRMSDCTCPGRR